jgi:uncharacterized protein YndB with AHSA1/START domain
MATTRVRRTLTAAPSDVWRLVADPHQLPDWWPRAVRVEGVTDKSFTVVMMSKRGREVRADQRVLANSRPRRRAWGLEIEGTPFERVFAAYEVHLTLEPADAGTRLTIESRQRLKGASRLGGPMARHAARRQLKQALDDLEALLQ